MHDETKKIIACFIGEDSRGHPVFRGDNGRLYKTTELAPRAGFLNVPRAEQERIFSSLCTTDAFDGEPDCHVKLSRFVLACSECKTV